MLLELLPNNCYSSFPSAIFVDYHVQRGQTYLEDHMIQTQNKISSIVTMLSKQEKNIFEAILQGKSNQQICDELFLSNRTVENYTSRLYSKISVKDREELIKKYSK